MLNTKHTNVELVSTDRAARMIGMSAHWLKTSRFRPELDGPPFLKIGRSVRYDIRDLTAWMDHRRYRGAHEIELPERVSEKEEA